MYTVFMSKRCCMQQSILFVQYSKTLLPLTFKLICPWLRQLMTLEIYMRTWKGKKIIYPLLILLLLLGVSWPDILLKVYDGNSCLEFQTPVPFVLFHILDYLNILTILLCWEGGEGEGKRERAAHSFILSTLLLL